MGTTQDNCSRLPFWCFNKTKWIYDIDIIIILLNTVICLILLGIYINQRRRQASKNAKSFDSSKQYLGFSDLPAAKARIPIKLIGNVLEIFPLQDASKALLKWSKENGDIFTCIGLGQKFVLLNSGPTVQALCKSGDFGHVAKAPVIYDPMKPFVTNGVLVSKGAFWQQQRRLIMKTQTFQSLKSHIPKIERHSRRLVGDLETRFEDGEYHQINDLINTAFIGIVNEVITGKDVDDLNELNEYHHNFSIWKESMFKRLINPLLQIKPIWMFHHLYKPHENAIEELTNFARRRLTEHLSTKRSEDDAYSTISKTRSMLDELVDAGVKEEQIIDEINTVMFGGHETGASTLHFLCFCLAINSEIQELARAEVDKLFEEREGMVGGVMTYDSIRTGLKYLERCILETLRLYPPVFAMVRKLETPLEIEYKGKPVLIPDGVNIVLCPLSMQRREELYPDPEKFDPDRFTPEECAKRHAYSFIPFSAGPRNCLGQKLGIIELKIIAAHILRHFELSTTDKLEDLKLLPYTTLTPGKDFDFQLKKRAF